MVKTLLMVCAAMPVLLCGCQSSAPVQYGNFTDVESQSLVNDAMTALLATYPPAQTRLALLHSATDPFGEKLVSALRARGYAVREYAETAAQKDKYAQVDLEFAYVLDESAEEGQYSLTLYIGKAIMSRSYAIRGSGDKHVFVGLGAWSRKVGE